MLLALCIMRAHEIGSGAFAKVHLGMNMSDGTLVAIKVVQIVPFEDDDGRMVRDRGRGKVIALEREIGLLRLLQHENIVQYLDHSRDKDEIKMVIEHVRGGSLDAIVCKAGRFRESLCRHFVRQMLQGLEYLHGNGILHCDLKCGNALVTETGTVKLADLGSYVREDRRATMDSLRGSIYWMAPEVVDGLVYSRQSDIWSIACVLVEMLEMFPPNFGLTLKLVGSRVRYLYSICDNSTGLRYY